MNGMEYESNTHVKMQMKRQKNILYGHKSASLSTYMLSQTPMHKVCGGVGG